MPSCRRTDLVASTFGILGSQGGHLDFQVYGTDAGIWKSETEMMVIPESLWSLKTCQRPEEEAWESLALSLGLARRH